MELTTEGKEHDQRCSIRSVLEEVAFCRISFRVEPDNRLECLTRRIPSAALRVTQLSMW
jgi:hypothetical protein